VGSSLASGLGGGIGDRYLGLTIGWDDCPIRSNK